MSVFKLKEFIKPSVFKNVQRVLNRNFASLNDGPKPITYLTDDERVMKETAALISKEQIAPFVKQMEKDEKLHPDVLNTLFNSGFMGIDVDEKYEGTGSTFMSSILVIEEISKIDPAVAVLVDIHNTLVNNLVKKLGTEEQKTKYLPLLTTKWPSSICISETSSGTDAFAMKSTAKKDGENYILNGSKMWISNADVAEFFLIFANAKPEAGYKGITCFIVERTMPGLTIGKPEKKLGIKASGTCAVHMDNVIVPESNILGKFGDGYKYIAGALNEGRIGIGAQQIGIAQGCFDATIPYTLDRKQFGSPIYKFQSMQHQIAQIATEIECARLLVYNAARAVENGEDVKKVGSMAKYYAAEVAQKTTIKCIDWLGGVGFTTDFPQEKFYRDCKIGSIYEGTTNIQLSTIAKCIENEYSQ